MSRHDNRPYYFYFDCVSWPSNDVHCEGGLVDLIDEAITITRKTFMSHVDRDDLRLVESQLGYESHPSKGPTMAGDWAVSYHRSKWHGKRVYFFKYSAIEYVFVNRLED